MPVLWALYADGPVVLIAKRGLGCYVTVVWMGAFLCTDDLFLLAPNHSILASMLALVGTYGAILNLIFSSNRTQNSTSRSAFYLLGPSRRVV